MGPIIIRSLGIIAAGFALAAQSVLGCPASASAETAVLRLPGEADMQLVGSAGHSVLEGATTPDLNGDGVAELLSLASNYSERFGGLVSASVRIVFSPYPLGTTSPVSALASQHFRLVLPRRRPAARDVVPVGDVNGDRFPDVAVVMWSTRARERRSPGTVYVVFGTGTGETIDLDALGGHGFRIGGAAQDDDLGEEIVGNADVNGDGLADLLIGSPDWDTWPQRNTGAAYVVFGKSTTEPVALSAPGSSGYRVGGIGGGSPALLGDMSGDGRAELAVQREVGDRNGLWVVFGKGDPAPVDLARTAPPGFRVQGAHWAAPAGDLNGDRRHDFFVGNADYGESPIATVSSRAPRARASLLVPEPRPGAVWVIFGKDSPEPVKLGALGAGGYLIAGSTAAPDQLNSAIAPGDVNGDGLQDVVVAGKGSNNCLAYGSSYVIFGRRTPADVDLTDVGPAGFRIDGARTLAGSRPIAPGDVDGDGLADLFIATQKGESAYGRLFAVRGRPRPPPPRDRTAPKMKLVVEHNHRRHLSRIVRKGTMSVDVTVTEAASVALRLEAQLGGMGRRTAPIPLGRTRVRVPGPGTTTVKFRLSRSAREALRTAQEKVRRRNAELRKRWREVVERHKQVRSAFFYGPSTDAHIVAYATGKIRDAAGNECGRSSGLFGSVELL